ncbi:TPA: hypothetical protein ACX6RZ_000500 [Photobacterium damselae]
MRTVSLNIKKDNVNDFLQLLWVELSEKIGPMSCQHFYLDTDDKEIYIYNVIWCVDQLSFITEFNFYNHTSKGLIRVDVCVKDKKNQTIDVESQKKILSIISEVNRTDFNSKIKNNCFKVPIEGPISFSGSYYFERVNIGLVAEDCFNYLIFDVKYITKSQSNVLIIEKIKLILAALSVCTQQVFEYVGGKIYSFDDCSVYDFLGESFNNFKQVESFVDYDEIIEDNKIVLPENTVNIISNIILSPKAQNSAMRFIESLRLRAEVFDNSILNGFKVQYELLGYVSSIESLLDTSEKNVVLNCPKCDEQIEKPQRRISAQFNEFVYNHSNNSSIVASTMKQLYNDRSKFVHMGKGLISQSRSSKQPLYLEGKTYKQNFPSYYFNIHEFTGALIRNSLRD